MYISIRKTLCICLLIIYKLSNAVTVDIPTGYEDKLSAVIINLNTNKVEYSYNPNTPRLIASNMKIVTTQVALNYIPIDYRYTTRIAYTGEIANTTLNGDLYIIGGGDPTLTRNDLALLLKQTKLKKINGNIYIDNTIFNSYPKYSMLREEKYDPDTVLPNGFIVDEQLVRFTIKTKNKINVSSNLYGYTIKNKLSIDPKLIGCGNTINENTDFDVSDNTITVTGKISKNCNNYTLVYNLLSPKEYSAMAIKYALNKSKINFEGKIKYNKSPADAVLITQIKSQNLANIIKTMNKYSNNLYAETVFLTLSPYLTKNNDSYSDASSIYESYIKTNSIYNDDFELENGAGLSRHEKLTASNLASLLIIAYHSDTYKTFFNSLPVAGGVGTLQNRFTNLGDKVHFKTGTLNDTSSYSGYYYSNNTPYLAVFIANDINTVNGNDMKVFNSWVNKLLNSLN